MLEMDLNKICYLVVKAREFDAQEDVVEPGDGANARDDRFRQVLEAYSGDPTFEELKQFIDNLNIDEQYQLVALAWLGRGDYSADEWEDALSMARDAHTPHTAAYLLGMPMLGDYIEEGLAAFELSCQDFEMTRL